MKLTPTSQAVNLEAALAYAMAGDTARAESNALRITLFVAFGNRGFADVVARFHISAGWVFFSAVFLISLCFTYPRLRAPLLEQRKTRPLTT